MSATPLRISFGPAGCTSLAEGGDREWLVADGCGGYAMGTVCGLRTRRYHGLLVVAVAGPSARRLGLVALDPVLTLPSGASVRLGVHEWSGGAVAPAGHTFLQSFDLDDGLPRWRWRVGEVVLERELAMRHGSASLAVVHRLLAGGPVHLSLEALVTWRDAHGERHAGAPLGVAPCDGGAVVEGSFRLRGPGWAGAGNWYRGVHARLEAQRGLNADEDVWLAGQFAAELSSAGDSLPVSAWAGELTIEPPPAPEVVAAARDRARNLVATANPTDEVAARLVLASDAFVTTAPDVVAGYPWFGAWSRDTRPPMRDCSSSPAGPRKGGHCCGPTPRRSPKECWPTPPTPARPSTTPPTPRCGSPTPSTVTSQLPAMSSSPPRSSRYWAK
jgi:predicted glycogen debranching enzyme